MDKLKHFMILPIALLLGCATQYAADPEQKSVRTFFEAPADQSQYAMTLQTDGSVNPKIAGIWVSEGFGVLLDLTSGSRPRQFLVSPAGCYIESLKVEDIDDLFHLYLQGDDNQTGYFTDHVGGTLYPFRRLDILPSGCFEEPNGSPAVNLEAFIQYADAHYPSFMVRNLDWKSLKDRSRKMLSDNPDDATLFEALSLIIENFDDTHTEFWDVEIEGKELAVSAGRGQTLGALYATFDTTEEQSTRSREIEWIQSFRQRVAEEILLGGGRREARGLIDWGWAADDVGYIQILGFGDYVREGGLSASVVEAHRVINEALAEMAEANAIIIDVSQNRGGYDVLARAVASHFAAERQPVYQSRPHNLIDNRWQAFTVDPSGLTTYSKPVFLLTSDITVSAGEVFVLAMRALPNVLQVGTVTRGALSVEIARTLPNGWAFGMSSEIIVDSRGTWFEGVGIPPDETINLYVINALDGLAHLDAVNALIERAKNLR